MEYISKGPIVFSTWNVKFNAKAGKGDSQLDYCKGYINVDTALSWVLGDEFKLDESIWPKFKA